MLRSYRIIVAVFIAGGTAACGGGGSSGDGAALNHSASSIPTAPAASADVIPRRYILTDLGTGLPGSPGLVPSGLNDNGAVVGESSIGILSSLPSCSPTTCGPQQGWIFQNGALRQLPPLGSDNASIADAINNDGVVSGGSAGAVVERAVLWHPNGTITDLGTGVGGPGGSAEAIGISNNGKIVGISVDATGASNIPTAFHVHEPASAPCGPNTQGYLREVNDEGLSAGLEFVSTGGLAAITCPPFTVIESPSSPGFIDFANDLNDNGEVVGRLTIGPSFGNFHAFVYRHGSTTDLGTLFPHNSASVSAAFGINEEGKIVGFSAEGGAVPGTLPINPRAFVYAGGRMVDLNTLIPAATRAQWTLVVASKINEKNQIVGSAFVGGYPNGVEHAFLLTRRCGDDREHDTCGDDHGE